MDKFYCFKHEPSTGEITRFDITDYKIEQCRWDKRSMDFVCFVDNFGTKADYRYTIAMDKLDRYSREKVFTFNGSYNHARDIIKDSIGKDLIRTKRKYKQLERALKKLEEVENEL